MKRIRPPKGYRMLKVGEIIKETDLSFFHSKWNERADLGLCGSVEYQKWHGKPSKDFHLPTCRKIENKPTTKVCYSANNTYLITDEQIRKIIADVTQRSADDSMLHLPVGFDIQNEHRFVLESEVREAQKRFLEHQSPWLSDRDRALIDACISYTILHAK